MNSLLKQFGDIQVLFGSNNRIQIREEDFLKYQDILNLLKVRGYIVVIDTSTLSGTSYLLVKNANFSDFYIWLKQEIKNEKKVKKREWIIAIISACIGAVIGLIPWLVSLFSKR